MTTSIINHKSSPLGSNLRTTNKIKHMMRTVKKEKAKQDRACMQ